MRASAAVFHGPDQPFELVSLNLSSLEDGHALVKVTCCTLCGSDLHTIRGDRPVSGPTILGHEMIGIVHRLPSEAPPCASDGLAIAEGDRITWSVAASCGECYFCRHGLPQKCESLFKYGHEAIGPRASASGGLSEYCLLVPGTAIVKLPEAIPDLVACPVNCATATVAAALRVAGAVEDKSVVIHGGGMLGLTMAAMTRAEGAASVLVTNPDQQRCQLAMRFGASDALDANDPVSIQRAIHQTTQGRGADVIFEMSGASSAAESSVDLLRIGGCLILVGSVFPSPAISVLPERIVRRMIRIEGIHNYLPSDLDHAIRFLERHQSEFPFHELVGAEYALSEIDQAVSEALSSSSTRIAIRPN